MTMINLHYRLMSVYGLIRPGIEIPTILQIPTGVGPTRQREVESYGANVTYVAHIVPQIHAQMDHQTAQNLARSGLAGQATYDEPTYAFTPTIQRTYAQIREGIQQRLQSTPHIKGIGSTLRAHLGAGIPNPLNPTDAILTLEDVRRYTRSKDLYDQGFTGKGVTVSILDTGLDESNPMLQGTVKQAASVVQDKAPGDPVGHGTWVAGCIAGQPTTYNGNIPNLQGVVLQGMAPEAKLNPIKVLNADGSGSTSGIIQGIELAVESQADIISMSLGSMLGGAGLTPDAEAVNAAVKKGIHTVVAAGNSFSWLAVGSPGSAEGAITVGSIAMQNPQPGFPSTFSSKGPTSDFRIKPTIGAPGGNLRPGEVILGPTSSGSVISQESGDSHWSLERGTSMATPCVSGIFAQLAHKGLPTDRDRMEELLAESARRHTPFPTKNNRVGWGVIDAINLRDAITKPPSLALGLYTKAVHLRSRPVLGGIADFAANLQNPPTANPNTLRLTLV